VQLTSNSGEVREALELRTPANGQTPFALRARFKDPRTTLLTLTVRDKSVDAVVFRMEIPCAIQQALKIASRSYPSFGVYRVEMDLTGLSDIPLGELRAMIIMQNRRTGKVTCKQVVRQLRAFRHEAELDVRRAPDGLYDVRVVVFRGDDAVVSRTMPFDKKPLPEWFGNKIGFSEAPPYPFEPIVVANADLRVWGRRYAFKGGLYPAQITVLGRKLLRDCCTWDAYAPFEYSLRWKWTTRRSSLQG